MPRFCIVIPTYNSAQTLKETINSCLTQTFDDFSIVVSDNNSNDVTEDVLSDFDNKKLHYIKNNLRLNKSENWNRAFNQAHDCDFLVNLHSDDVLDKNCLQNISKYLSKDRIFIHGANKRISFEGNVLTNKLHFPFKYAMSEFTFTESIILNNHVGIVGTAIRQNYFQKTQGWDINLEFFQDVNLWLDLVKFGKSLYLPNIFGFYRQPKAFNPNKYIMEMINWYEKYIKFEENLRFRSAAINSLENKLIKIINSRDNAIDPLVLEFSFNKYKEISTLNHSRYNTFVRLSYLKFRSIST